MGLSIFSIHDGNEVEVTFHPMPMPEVQEEILSSLLVRYLMRILRINLVQRKVARSPSLDLDPTSMILILILVKSLKDFLFLLIWEKSKCLKNNKLGS